MTGEVQTQLRKDKQRSEDEQRGTETGVEKANESDKPSESSNESDEPSESSESDRLFVPTV